MAKVTRTKHAARECTYGVEFEFDDGYTDFALSLQRSMQLGGNSKFRTIIKSNLAAAATPSAFVHAHS
jgi:hypothetical protein